MPERLVTRYSHFAGRTGGGTFLALALTLLGANESWAQLQTESWGWTYLTGGNVYSSPAVADDGTVYVGSGDDKLYALESNGTLKWTFEEATDWLDSSPAIGSDGTIYIGSWDNKMYAVDPTTGASKWSFETDSAITSSPAIGAGGVIYFGSNDYFFYALESNGSEKWSYFVGDEINSSPAIGADGTIYFGDDNGSLHALNEDGTLKWSYTVPDVVAESNNTILSSPALDLSGNVYFGCSNGFFYSIADNTTSASLNWSYETGEAIDVSPVLGPEGNLYLVSRDGYLRALDPVGGIEYWNAAVGDVFYSTPVVDSTGKVYVAAYVGGGNNVVSVYESNGTLAWTSTSASITVGGVVDSSLTLTANGYLLFGCFDDKLYAINMGNPLADSDWPKFKRNLVADGRWPTYYVDANASPAAGGSVTGAGTYIEGASVALTATPATGYAFNSWSGDASGTNSTFSISSLTSNQSATANFTILQYALGLTAGTGGEVSGAGTYDHGTSASITATPSTGYHFTGWTGATVTDATAASTTITLTQAENLIANFALNQYLLTVGSGAGGTATGDGNFTHGDVANLVATPSTGYHFVNWTGDAVADANAPTTTATMDQNRTVTANFAIDQHVLTLNAGTGGTVSGDGTFDYGTDANVTASPTTGYHFVSWAGAGVASSSSASTTVTMDQNRTVSASFAIDQHVLTLTAGTGGTVSSGGTFDYGTSQVVTATPSAGYHFVNWSGATVADSSSASTTITLTADSTLTANFEADVHVLTLSATAGGSVSGEGNYSYGVDANVSATADSGYFFTGWSGNGAANPSSSTTTVSMTQDRNLTASFDLIPTNQYVLQTFANPIGGGSTTGGGTHDENSPVEINATANAGFWFLGWNASGGTLASPASSSTTITLDQGSDTNATAHFSAMTLAIDLHATTGGSVTGDGNYSMGQSAAITATADTGYTFAGWEVNGTMEFSVTAGARQYATSSNALFIDGDESPPLTLVRGMTYQFSLDGTTTSAHPFYFSTDSSGGGNSYLGEITIGVTNSKATSGVVTLTIDEDTPSLFYYYCGVHSGMGAAIQVIDNSGLIADANATSTTADANGSYVAQANFSLNQQSLSLTAGTGGSVSGAGTYGYGSQVAIVAAPNPGYVFESWSGNGATDSNASSTTVSMTADRNLTANFEAAVYTLNVAVDANGGGTVAADGTTFTYGQTATVTAFPSNGYVFAGWNGEGLADANASSTTVTISDTQTVTATFAQATYEVNLQTDPLAAGTTNGSGTYDYASSANLVATPAHGYSFSHWSGLFLSDYNATSIAVPVTQEIALTAHFVAHDDVGELSYELNATDLEAGWKQSHWFGFFNQVDDNWSYHYDFGWIYVDQVANGDFWFWHETIGWLWTNGDTFPSCWNKTKSDWIRFAQDTATGNLQTNADGRLWYFDYANTLWTNPLPTYEIAATISPVNGGTVTGTGSFVEGETVTLVAAPADGFEFSGWSGYGITTPQAQFTATSDLSVTAVFTRIENQEGTGESTSDTIDSLFGR